MTARLRLFLSAISAIACASTIGVAHAACYTMYDARNTAVYQSSTAPIDLRGSISAQMARRFPSRYLVISDTPSCFEINVVAVAVNGRVGANANPAALLTRTPNADRFDGPYLDTSPAPQTAPGAMPASGTVDGDGYGGGIVRDGNTIVVPQGPYGTQPAVPYGTPGASSGSAATTQAPARVR